MATALNIIERGLRTIGALNRGFNVAAEDAQDALESLNELIADWKTEDLMIPYRTRENFSLTPGTREYTIGSGGAFDTVRPLTIHSAFIRDSSGTDYELEVTMTVNDEARIAVKSSQARPTRLYYEPIDPLSKIYFDFTPGTADTLYLSSLKELASFTSLASTDSVPDEYLSALRFNLGLRLAPEYGKSVPQEVMAMAISTKASLKNKNLSMRVPKMSVDRALRTRSRYLTIESG